MESKVLADSRIIFLHDSSNCERCEACITFYQNFNQSTNLSSQERKDLGVQGVHYQGIISYLRFIFKLEFNSELLNNVGSPCGYNLSSEISFDTRLNQWDLKRDIESKKKFKKEVTSVDTATEQPKTQPFVSVREKTVKKTKKITLAKGSSSRNRLAKDRKRSSYARRSKIPLRKNTWKRAKKNAAKVNILKVAKLEKLKRKRWNMLKRKNNGSYEDDLYANKTFYKIPGMQEDSSVDSEIYNIPTPAFPLTPRERSRSPICEDCYNATELGICREEAEKYQFQRNKRKFTNSTSTNKDYSPQDKSEVKKTTERLLETIEKLKKLEKNQDEEDNESDYYFSDMDEGKE